MKTKILIIYIIVFVAISLWLLYGIVILKGVMIGKESSECITPDQEDKIWKAKDELIEMHKEGNRRLKEEKEELIKQLEEEQKSRAYWWTQANQSKEE